MQKTNFKTRLLALLTAVFMVVMCVPFAAFAETNEKTIHVAFTDENAVLLKEYDITAMSKECAPELPDNYYWKSNFSSYGVGDLNSNDPINFDNLTKAPWPHVGFTKTEKPAPATKFDYYIQNTDKNGYVAVLGDAQVQNLTYDNGTETLPLPYEKITANDGYKFDGWKISVQPVEGSVKEFTVPAGTQSFSIKEYGELNLVGASAIFSKVETPVTYFDYTIQNASKNGKVAVLGDAQIQTVSLPSTTTVLDLPYEKITANDGYVFAGWTIYVQPKNGNADKFVVKAGAKSVDVSKYGDLALAGASAIFEKKTDDKKDNSTSSSSSSNNNTSSSSSSSNKTTTASNQKQVVKAAAAPANTTKVLPKTGASNVAPLLGGSLAVVALLMGYGVYSLVLRKKD